MSTVHLPLSMDARVVLLTERDQLVLEWQLHHVRWLLSSLAAEARALADPYRYPPLAEMDVWARRDLQQAGLTPERLNAESDAKWEGAMGFLSARCTEHAAEERWWATHRDTAPLALLREAVRTMMAKAGGAKAAGFSAADARCEQDGPADVRSLRHLLRVRAEIARRRCLCGEIMLVMAEATADAARGREWAQAMLGKGSYDESGILGRIAQLAYSDHAAAGLSTAALCQLVMRREAAAAAHDVTGTHRAPAMIDFDLVGAHDTVSR